MKIYDHLDDRMKEISSAENSLKIYVCGPTVYDEPHLGHLRTYIFYDTLAKYLKAKGKEVFYIQNITDIDDKIINRARELEKDPLELSREFERKYMEIMQMAGVDSVNIYVRATDHIKDMIKLIRSMEKRGLTYKLPDGIYFRVWMDKNYGVLSRQKSDKQVKGARANVSDYKEDDRDFVLWKFQKEGEINWNSPWGRGRPGWHLEDVAISSRYLGKTFNIHGAGLDLKFPHNESELSIMRMIKGNNHMCDFWTFTGLLQINGEKMSKSLGNTVSAEKILEKYGKESVRAWVLMSHYSSDLNFSEDSIKEAEEIVFQINRAYQLLWKNSMGTVDLKISKFKAVMNKHMENNYDTRNALLSLLELSKTINEINDGISPTSRSEAINFFNYANSFLGILRKTERYLKKETVDMIVKVRNELRKKKMFNEADILRESMLKSGIVIEDKNEQSEWYYE
ncbi:cysteine--tRNA ligase [Caldiplasma sukawensis]